MITLEEVDRILDQHITQTLVEELDLNSANRRILAENIICEQDFPQSPHSQITGYACTHSELPNCKLTSVISNEKLPDGCDTVLPKHFVENGQPTEHALTQVPANYGVIKAGETLQSGETAIKKGTRLNPMKMALLKSLGYNSVKVFQEPKIAIFDFTESDQKGFRTAIIQLLRQRMFIAETIKDLEFLPQPTFLQKKLNSYDLILTIADTSATHQERLDYFKAFKIESAFQEIPCHPAEDLSFHRLEGGTPLLHLPPTATAAIMAMMRFIIPKLQKAKGLTEPFVHRARLTDMYSYTPQKSLLLPVTLKDNHAINLQVKPEEKASLSSLEALGLSDGFVELPAEQARFPFGFEVQYFPWTPLT